MKIRVLGIAHYKDGKRTDATTPDSDLVMFITVKTRRKKRSIAYNITTRRAYEQQKEYFYFQPKQMINLKASTLLHLDAESLDMFDEAFALFVGDKDRIILKNHAITISPDV